MITYALAKQLKDTGFYQKYHDMGTYYLSNQVIIPYSCIKNVIGGSGENISATQTGAIYIPTLSELIKECRNESFMLVFRPYKKWNASTIINLCRRRRKYTRRSSGKTLVSN